MIKIGGVSLTHTPTTDIREELLLMLGEGFEIIEAGALDGLSKDDILALAPGEGESALVGALDDGTNIICREDAITTRLSQVADELEKQGVSAMVLYCGGDYRDLFHTSVPMITPLQLMRGVVPALTSTGKVAVLTPLPSQRPESIRKWDQYVKEPVPVIGNPLEGMDVVRRLAEEVRDIDVDLAVLDCFGFTIEMKKEFDRISGKPSVASRTLIARILKEMFT